MGRSYRAPGFLWERATRAIPRRLIAAMGRSYRDPGFLWERAMRASSRMAGLLSPRRYGCAGS